MRGDDLIQGGGAQASPGQKFLRALFEDDRALVNGLLGTAIGQNQVARGHTVTGFEPLSRMNPTPIQKCPVLAAQIRNDPILFLLFQHEVLSRQARIFWITEVILTRPADRPSGLCEWDGLGLSVRKVYDQFSFHIRLDLWVRYLHSGVLPRPELEVRQSYLILALDVKPKLASHGPGVFPFIKGYPSASIQDSGDYRLRSNFQLEGVG